MTESVNSPATQPIQDKAPKPPGLMPKNVQTWAMLGLAVLMVSIMWLTGGKKPQTLPKSGTSAVQTPAPLEVNEGKIAELQNRIQELQREQQVALNQQNKFFGAIQSESQTAAPAQVAGTAQPPPATPSDPIQDERKKRAYVSLFSSNVALSYRKDLAQPELAPGTASPTNNPFGLPGLPAQEPTFNQQLAQILQGLPPAPQLIPPHRLPLATRPRRAQPQPKMQKGKPPRVPRSKLHQIHLHSTPQMEKATSSLKERSSKPYC